MLMTVLEVGTSFCWSHIRWIVRPTLSSEPPAEDGTIKPIFRSGTHAACAARLHANAKNDIKHLILLSFFIFSSFGL
jgi:hypothetical protein